MERDFLRLRMGTSTPYAALAMTSLLIGCGMSRETILECKAPDGEHIAEFYREYGGGAAGSQSEFVSVRRSDTSKRQVVLEMDRGYDVRLDWTSANHLVITYPGTARVRLYKSEFDVQIGGDKYRSWGSELKSAESTEGQFVTGKTACGNGPSP
jgi:hypothetical protein